MNNPYFSLLCGGGTCLIALAILQDTLRDHETPHLTDAVHVVSVQLRDPVLEIDVRGATPTPVCKPALGELNVNTCYKIVRGPKEVVIRYGLEDEGRSRDCRAFLPLVIIDGRPYGVVPAPSSLTRGCRYTINDYPVLLSAADQ